MAIDIDLAVKIAGPIVGGVLAKIFSDLVEKRPRLVCFYGHSNGVNLPQRENSPSLRVHTHSLVVANQGWKAATNVRLGHAQLPDFEIFPDIQYSTTTLPGGTREIIVPTVGPKEQITVTYLYFAPVTWDKINIYVKSDAGLAKVLRVLPAAQWPKWVNYCVWGLVLVGLGTLVYLPVALLTP